MSKGKKEKVPKRPMWSGSITIGLVNVPVKLHTMIFDKGISFRFLHKDDGQPLKYERVCTKENKVVPWEVPKKPNILPEGPRIKADHWLHPMRS